MKSADNEAPTELSPVDLRGYRAALESARQGKASAGIPIGSSLANSERVLAAAHNRRVQDNDPTAHAEISALRAAGRRTDHNELTLYTTLAPCALCSGAIVQFKIPRVVVGEWTNFTGEIQWLRSRGVQVLIMEDLEATALMHEFITSYPELWNEDIAHYGAERNRS
ncbi:nucleoside deaminase [Glutamicibacter sp. JC586]|uniref:nucleoside deaminase n=1 Tax=Glutamicibacter sp. JC586 TaxID=2590552 RepID=UPI0013571D7B|nr:nucleoside deaminase [Glutamicibacter sp. JC586]